MKKVSLLYSIILSILLYSCEDKSRTINSSQTNIEDEKPNTHHQTENWHIENYVESIEKDIKNFETTSSFLFSNETNEVSVTAYLNDGIVVKLEEKFQEFVKNTYGTRSYYIKDNELLFSKEIQEILLIDGNYEMCEIITYYKNSVPKTSYTRKAAFEEDLDYQKYDEIPAIEHPYTQAVNIITAQENYSIYFHDIISSGNTFFIVLKTKHDSPYKTTLKIEYEDEVTKELKNNKQKHKNKRVEMRFERVIRNGMSYQAYRGGEIID